MPDSNSRTPTLVAILAVGAVLVSASAALAAGARLARPATDAPAPGAARGARAVVTTSVVNPMRETAPGVYEGIIPVQRPDGSWMVLLDERFHQYTVAVRADGGPLVRGCVHGAGGVAAWRAAARPAALPGTGAAACGAVPRVSSPDGTAITTWEAR